MPPSRSGSCTDPRHGPSMTTATTRLQRPMARESASLVPLRSIDPARGRCLGRDHPSMDRFPVDRDETCLACLIAPPNSDSNGEVPVRCPGMPGKRPEFTKLKQRFFRRDTREPVYKGKRAPHPDPASVLGAAPGSRTGSRCDTPDPQWGREFRVNPGIGAWLGALAVASTSTRPTILSLTPPGTRRHLRRPRHLPHPRPRRIAPDLMGSAECGG